MPAVIDQTTFLLRAVVNRTMRYLILFAVLSVASAAPAPAPGLYGGLGALSYGGWGGAPAYSSVAVSQPYVHSAPILQAAPVVHSAPILQAAPVVHAPVAIAKPAATSYSSFQQVVHPVSIAQPVVHASPVISQPIVQAAPVVQTVAQPIVQSYHAPIVSQPLVQKYLSVGSYGHGW